jgi:putative inorganic carbon (hco3(-)) transporter
VERIRGLVQPAFRELPERACARWAALFFSFSVLTFLFSIAAAQAFLALATLCYIIYWLRRRPTIAFPGIELPLVLFCLFTVLSVFWATNPAAGWFAVRKLVLFVIIPLTVNLVVSRKHLEWLYKALFVESAFVGAVAIGQFVRQYRTIRALHPHHVYSYMITTRISGFMGHWMNFGGQQMLVFACFMAFLLFVPQVSRFWWLAMAVTAASIILNFTRGVWLGSFVAALYLVIRWKPRWLLLLPALALAGYFLSPSLVRKRVWLAFHPSQEPALSMRLEIWRVGWRMIRAHPWVGVGPNNIVEVYDLYLPPGVTPLAGFHSHMHNDFMQFAAERGLPCLAAWVWLMMAFLWQDLKIRKRSGSWRWIVDGAIAAWLALIAEGCFEFNFGTSPVLMLFLFVASTPFVVARLGQQEQSVPPKTQHV